MQGALSGRYELNRRVQDPLFQWNKVTHTLTHVILAKYTLVAIDNPKISLNIRLRKIVVVLANNIS